MLAEDHLARKISRLVDEDLDLGFLAGAYAGRGSRPHRPDLLLKLALYEQQIGRQRPAQWYKDLQENTVVQWLARGSVVARSVFYEFRDRVQPFLREFNTQVVRTAIDGTEQQFGVIFEQEDGSALA